MSETKSDLVDYQALARLDGQVHAIVGGGSGIGLESARALAAFGATVICLDSDPAAAENAAAEVGGTPAVADVRDDEAFAEALTSAVQEHGRLDGVIDVVGRGRHGHISEFDRKDFDEVYELGAVQALACLRLGAKLMTGPGSIVFVASVNGGRSSAFNAVYGSSKAAILSLVRSAAVELGPVGIRVNAVSPGVTRTPLLRSEEYASLLRANTAITPLGRLAEPSDIASALLYLSLPLARHVTGQDIVVDGGLSQRSAQVPVGGWGAWSDALTEPQEPLEISRP
ncbi:SDR family NAD(P)-dependent oxidoreductase [Rhodococcus koreensis]|uniref:SDR family NAD(P)-dependent oxidoreductase n=1 Tax=Rhodococcus koreensis TaxID=99653 RepID=UPI0036DE3037